MVKEKNVEAKIDNTCTIYLGKSSWNDGKDKSIKFAWFNKKNGRMSRGGEIPVKALPQMLEFAIKEGYLELNH